MKHTNNPSHPAGKSRLAKHPRGTAGILAVLICSFVLAGCQGTGNKDLAQLGGAAAGAALGSQVGGDSTGQALGAAAGAALGGFLGGEAYDYLSSNDRQMLASSTRSTAYTGQPNAFRNQNTGVSGQTYVSGQYRSEQSDLPCREIQQTVKLPDGTTQEHAVLACKQPDGS